MIQFLAQATIETKPDLSLPLAGDNISTSSGFQFIQMLFVLGIIVFAIKFFLPKFIFKINPGLQETGIASLKIEESATFASGKLFIVNVHHKKLLLAATPQNINLLADLTSLGVQNNSSTLQNESSAFFEVLDNTSQRSRFESSPSEEFVSPEIKSFAKNVNPNEIQSVLDRMSRFTGS